MSRWRKAVAETPVTQVTRVQSLLLLGGAAMLLGVNHLGVVWGMGVHAEAMICAGLFIPIGLLWAAWPGSLTAVERLHRRQILWGVAAGLLLAVAGFVTGELLTRWWYGETLIP